MNIKDNEKISECIEFVRRYNESLTAEKKAPLAYVLTFGCQQNEADSERIRGMAKMMGYGITDSPENASLIVMNTCAIREHAEQKALSILGTYKRIKAERPETIIAVCGCMGAEAHRVDALKKSYHQVSFTLEPSSLHLFPISLCRALRDGKRTFQSEPGVPEVIEGMPEERELSHRAWVSIMYGCNNFCSYCIVPYVRGRERSRASGDILAEIEYLVSRGYKDITLLGQNVNSYRGDCDFATLLERAAKINGDFTLRFMTSHPKDVPPRLIEVIKDNPKIARHFHLPVQSGSDKILGKMNRKYTREKYLNTLHALREAIPGISITSDIIVGFPGESDKDFEDTLSLLSEARFDMVYSFIYSRRVGTPAAEMECQVAPDIQNARMARLLEVQRDISRECNNAYVGREVTVLVDGESRTDSSVLTSRTSEGKLVHFSAQDVSVGDTCKVKIDRAEAFALYGTIIK